jgi:hypothetical protein
VAVRASLIAYEKMWWRHLDVLGRTYRRSELGTRRDLLAFFICMQEGTTNFLEPMVRLPAHHD